MSTKQCPECGEQIAANAKRHYACGWSDDRQQSKIKPLTDAMRQLCAHVENGLRCGNIGTIGSSVRGHGGADGNESPQWYCHKHYPPFSGAFRDDPINQGLPPNPSFQHLASYAAKGETSFDLTEQQWYNVCRFWPSVARRCKRPFADVGPHNPLHATSKLGPLARPERPANDGSLIE